MRSVIAPSDVTTPMIAFSRVLDDELALAVTLPLVFPDVLPELPFAFSTGKLETTCDARSLYGVPSAV